MYLIQELKTEVNLYGFDHVLLYIKIVYSQIVWSWTESSLFLGYLKLKLSSFCTYLLA